MPEIEGGTDDLLGNKQSAGGEMSSEEKQSLTSRVEQIFRRISSGNSSPDIKRLMSDIDALIKDIDGGSITVSEAEKNIATIITFISAFSGEREIIDTKSIADESRQKVEIITEETEYNKDSFMKTLFKLLAYSPGVIGEVLKLFSNQEVVEEQLDKVKESIINDNQNKATSMVIDGNEVDNFVEFAKNNADIIKNVLKELANQTPNGPSPSPKSASAAQDHLPKNTGREP